MTYNKHTVRLASILAVLVVALVLISVSDLRSSGDHEQQAAVLRAYAE